MTQPHHTAEHWAKRTRSLDEFVVDLVEDHGERVRLRSTKGWGWMPLKADLGREIRVGEHLQQETIGLSQVTGLRDANGWLFRRTNQELADEARQFSEELHRKDVVRLEQNRKLYAQWEAELPAWLQARIRRFREAGGEHFLLTGWGYELMICRLADLIDRGLEAEADKLASDEGATGNQWDCAKALAAGRQRDGDEYAALLPAGLAPLTGSADYS
ncbi:hypothetical protein [Mycobacterium asiaticum]|uniref:Uncharacterized protein n=1 Tax=Mycobacterium asiaticum TaxID=1790 RepID=A0A1A3NME6_MYCAS|nr:hypothetical protein [Mycobacterium asiaticum]OBK22525.1 hypothetical protein A5635_21655 [Mycobacterium asiaticum]